MSNRHTAARLSVAALLAIIGLSISMMTYAQSASSDSSASSSSSVSGVGTITIEQEGAASEWVLIKPGNKRTTLHKETYTIQNAELGNYTLLVTPPAGASSSVTLYLGDDLLESYDHPQASFKLEQGMHMRLGNRESLYFKKVEEALLRIQEGVYGICKSCDGDIGAKRLEARPTAEMCIDCKEAEERRERHSADGRRAKSLGATINLKA